jgi:hypothetical protein
MGGGEADLEKQSEKRRVSSITFQVFERYTNEK